MLEQISKNDGLAKIFLKPEVQTIMNLNAQYAKALIANYKSSTELANKIIEQINREIK